MFRLIVVIVLLGFTQVSLAEPEQFVWKKVSGGASKKKMQTVYDRIPYYSGDKQQARLAIIQAMQKTKGTAWLIEAEGEGYVLARWDYKGHAIIHRIEYDNEHVQVKYAGGVNEYTCKKLIDDYCYKTHRNYYKYNVSLIKNLKIALSELKG